MDASLTSAIILRHLWQGECGRAGVCVVCVCVCVCGGEEREIVEGNELEGVDNGTGVIGAIGSSRRYLTNYDEFIFE